MPYRKATARAGFALLVLGISLAASQSERRRKFDVPQFPPPRKPYGRRLLRAVPVAHGWLRRGTFERDYGTVCAPL